MSLIKHAGGNGRIVAKAAEDLISGCVVKVLRVNNEWKAYQVDASGDLTNYLCGLAYHDITTKARQGWGVEITTTVAAAVDSKPWEEIAEGETLVVMSGPDLYVDTDYVMDGNYQPNDSLEVSFDGDNAGKLQIYSSGTKVGKVDTPAIVTSRNKYVRCRISIGNAV